MTGLRKTLGICIGASSIKSAELVRRGEDLRVGRTNVTSHDCDVQGGLTRLVQQFPLHGYDSVAVTGRNIKDGLNLPAITEPEAVEGALKFITDNTTDHFDALLSLGSETFALYQLDPVGDIRDVRTGGKCASGTGEFFVQQIRRMGMSLDDAVQIASDTVPCRVCGRCSVFCKSDCTHALNRGIAKERVCAGLIEMIADKVWELLAGLPRLRVLAVGGMTRNAYLMGQLRRRVETLVVPSHAVVFEALGAAAFAMAQPSGRPPQLAFPVSSPAHPTLPPLRDAQHLVTFHQHQTADACDGDLAVLGLDVGSTTTKAVLLRIEDDAVLARVYLKTNGDPLGAARGCYLELARQLGDARIHIQALGATGSGRQIAGLHAGTDTIINEIIAHATAATSFAPDVDTILEIGGQDAKYTALVHGIPCDYAMNEACSAGTGSFLEEAAWEALGVDVCAIQDFALRADAPANFSDQCAAFIASDLKNASHVVRRDDMLAGLVYSVCMNYNHRVCGVRRVGRKIFMQGGVCYNQAVPVAMAALLNQAIIVPPDPGMMGAIGVALETKQQLGQGWLPSTRYDLRELAARDAHRAPSFQCRGTKENCDRGCTIDVFRFNGKSLPFGGACNKYYNAVHGSAIDSVPLDFVARRQQALLSQSSPLSVPQQSVEGGVCQFETTPEAEPSAKRVGLNRSFLFHTLFPLYQRFFTALGFQIMLPETPDQEAMSRPRASLCFPAHIAHGMMADLIKRKPDYFFLPQVYELHVAQADISRPCHQSTCIFVQAEPDYLRHVFEELDDRVLSPQLNWARGWSSMESEFVQLGTRLGAAPDQAASAYRSAIDVQMAFFSRREQLGLEALREIQQDPQRIGVVLFGRSYNAFADEANLGIPRKFASRGVYCIPYDCLPCATEPVSERMTWAAGHEVLRAARFVKRHPQLFAAFVTNFSCGPDSFLITDFRDVMQTKPSLVLEVDGHTADAGLNTRIDAFLDILKHWRRLNVTDPPPASFTPLRLVWRKDKPRVVAADGTGYRLEDPRVKVVFPSMGRTLSEAACAVFQGFGIHAEALPPASVQTLRKGRANCSCKECLPLTLITGTLLEHLANRRNDDLLLWFVPTATGGCRMPQYRVHLERLIAKHQVPGVAVLSLASAHGYAGLGIRRSLTLLKAIIVADLMDDIRNALAVLAADPGHAAGVFDAVWQLVLKCFAARGRGLYRVLGQIAEQLRRIPLARRLDEAPRVLLAGEVFARKDEFSSQAVVDALAHKGIVVQRAPLVEWFHYVDYWNQEIDRRKPSLRNRLEVDLRRLVQHGIERRIIRRLAPSGLCSSATTDLPSILASGEPYVGHLSGGEAVLVIGRYFDDLAREFDGMISIGPFGCLPTRVVEAILTPSPRRSETEQFDGHRSVDDGQSVPFLSLEADGNPLPQGLETRLDAFCLQVRRGFWGAKERLRQVASHPRRLLEK